MKYRHYFLLALILLIGGFILWQAPSFIDHGMVRGIVPGMVFATYIVAGILTLIIAVIRLISVVIRKSRGKITNNDSENKSAFKGLTTAIVFVFFALLPVLVGLLSFPAQAFVHDYHFNTNAHPVSFINAGTVGLASQAIFLITALTLVIYTIKLGVTKRVSWVWIIVTVIVTGTAIVAGGMMLLFAGFIGLIGS
jgi:hypothetical protein